MQYDIADKTCLNIIRKTQAAAGFTAPQAAAESALDAAASTQTSTLISQALNGVRNRFEMDVTNLENFFTTMTAMGTYAVERYQGASDEMARTAAEAAFLATPPGELPGRGFGSPRALAD